MALTLEVGYLADMLKVDMEGAKLFRNEMDKLTPFLKSSGLKPHAEPEECPVWSAEMFGYSGLHHLRRLAAHLNLKGSLPAPGGQDAAKDPVLNKYFNLSDKAKRSLMARMLGRKKIVREYDHLLVHDDAKGYYLPQDFSKVLFPPRKLEITGGMIGSSHRLLEETRKLAAAIELPLDIDPDSPKVWNAADNQGQGNLLWEKYGVESFSCLRLHKAAKLSIEHSAALVFT